MGRPRKPTSELSLRGAFQRNPSRLKEREGEPVVTGALGPPPDFLSDRAKAVWLEMAGHGTWLTAADRMMVEIAADLMAQFRSDAANTRRVAVLVTVLNKLGFGPAERSKIRAPQAKAIEINPFEAFKFGG
jgi:hypothetical protein